MRVSWASKILKISLCLVVSMLSLTPIVNAKEVGSVIELNNCLKDANETVCKLANDLEGTTFNFFAMFKKELDLNNKVLNLHTNTFTIHRNANITIKNGTIKSEVVKKDTSGIKVRSTGKLKLDNVSIISDTVDTLLKAESNSKLEINNSNITLNKELGKALYIVGEVGNKTDVYVDSNSKIFGNYGVVIDGVGSNKDASGVKLNFYGTVEGVPSSSSGGIGITINGLVTETTGDVPVINVYDGALIKGNTAVYGAGYGIWNFYGGNFIGDSSLSIKSGVFNIYGGTYRATGEYVEQPSEDSGYVTKTGSAISITYNEDYAKNVELNIENATVESENGYALYESDLNQNNPISSISISGGTFKGEKGTVYIDSVNNKVFEGFISGGNYNSKLDDIFVNSSYIQKKFGNSFVIGIEKNIIVNSFENGNVIASKAKAINGEIVELKVEPMDGYFLKNLSVLDSEGNVIAINDYKFVMPNSDVTIDATFSKTINNEIKQNPDTFDNVMIYMLFCGIGLIFISLDLYILKKDKLFIK